MKKILLFISFLATLILTSCGKNKIVITSIQDLENKTVGCQAGTSGEDFLCNNFNSIAIRPFRAASETSLALKNKEIDAMIADEYLAREIVKQNKDLKIYDLNLPAEEYAIAVKKGNKELLDSINQTIHLVKESGTYDILLKSFMPQDGKIIIPEIEALRTKDTLKMGTNAAFPPFEYTNGTDVVGFDICLGTYIANAYGKRLQIIDMSFTSLVDAILNDSIDFIAAGMTINEERKRLVDFSDTYFSSKQVFIVRK